jgi:hypothetical protein
VQILLNQSRELIERYHALIEHGEIDLKELSHEIGSGHA